MDQLHREVLSRAEHTVRETWQELKLWDTIEDAVRGHRAETAIHAAVMRAHTRFRAALDVLADTYEDATSLSEKQEPR